MVTKCLKDGKQCWKGNYTLKGFEINALFTWKLEK